MSGVKIFLVCDGHMYCKYQCNVNVNGTETSLACEDTSLVCEGTSLVYEGHMSRHVLHKINVIM